MIYDDVQSTVIAKVQASAYFAGLADIVLADNGLDAAVINAAFESEGVCVRVAPVTSARLIDSAPGVMSLEATASLILEIDPAINGQIGKANFIPDTAVREIVKAVTAPVADMSNDFRLSSGGECIQTLNNTSGLISILIIFDQLITI